MPCQIIQHAFDARVKIDSAKRTTAAALLRQIIQKGTAKPIICK